MATQDQIIDIPLIGGLSEQADEANIRPPGFLRLENGILDKSGAIRKRKGAVISNSNTLVMNHEPRWISEYGEDVVMGATDGVYTFPGTFGRRTNSPSATFDTSMDHRNLSGIPSDIIQIDSYSENGLTFVVFTRDTTGAAFPNVGNEIWYAVYDTETAQLVRRPAQITGGSAIIRPMVVSNGTFASFWWIDGTDVKYTSGLPYTNLSSVNILPVFVVNTATSMGAATDIAWERLAGTDVVTMGIAGNAVGIMTATTTLVTANWTVRPTQNYNTAFRLVRGRVFLNVDELCVVAAEGVSTQNYGQFEVWKYNIVSNTWTAGPFADYFRGTPSDGTVTITTSAYFPQATRFSLGKGYDLSGNEYLTLFGGTHYSNQTTGQVPFSFGVGCSVSYHTIREDFSSAWLFREQKYTYTVATECFPIAGRRSWACGIKRSGIDVAQVSYTPAPEDLEYFYAEDFASVIFIAPIEGPGVALTLTSPISKAFDLRADIDVWIGDASFGGGRVFNPISLGRPFVKGDLAGTVSIFARTKSFVGTAESKITGGAGNDTFTKVVATNRLAREYNFEVAIMETRPCPQTHPLVNGLLVGGSLVDCFDGAFSSEMVPHDAPFVSTSFNSIDAELDEFYTVVYTWVDAQGNIHRSPISNRALGDVEDGPRPFADHVCYVWDFPVTSFIDTTAAFIRPYRIEVYKETLTKPIPVLVGIATMPFLTRVPTAPHILRVVIDLPAITTVAGGNIYTAGDVLENQAPPVFKSLCATKGRVFGLTSDKVFFSKPIEDRVAPEFNYNLTVSVPDSAGDTTAIAALDDKIVVFCENGLYILYGDGPNAAGAGGSFSQLLPIPGNIGCITKGSVGECPKGIAFLSEQGFYLIDRGLNLQFIGTPVTDKSANLLASNTGYFDIVSAVHDVEGRHVRWICDPYKEDPFHLIWYYDTNQWGVFSALGELHSILINNNIRSLYGVGAQATYIATEDPLVATYGGVATPMVARTGWIATAGIEGFQRAKRIAFLFRPGADPNGTAPIPKQPLFVDLFSDYQTAVDSTHDWDEAAMTAMPDNQLLELQVQVKVQKVAAISIQFREDVMTGQSLEGVGATLSGITMRIGARKGPQKHLSVARKR